MSLLAWAVNAVALVLLGYCWLVLFVLGLCTRYASDAEGRARRRRFHMANAVAGAWLVAFTVWDVAVVDREALPYLYATVSTPQLVFDAIWPEVTVAALLWWDLRYHHNLRAGWRLTPKLIRVVLVLIGMGLLGALGWLVLWFASGCWEQGIPVGISTGFVLWPPVLAGLSLWSVVGITALIAPLGSIRMHRIRRRAALSPWVRTTPGHLFA
jgi:hypothetical protein